MQFQIPPNGGWIWVEPALVQVMAGTSFWLSSLSTGKLGSLAFIPTEVYSQASKLASWLVVK